ncbi:N-acetylglucosaminylphosphatidylinositoldeacety la se [Mycena belliarum]|uniref:N-acetylglucosaminylphosphatidylinositol deacetylase n=1 Tax=Mycena belliarum TaxID=1033014 RepID=A0AAD6XUD6_9AGAR|nr:N-acetylglucosaminylphosphatidylinositoldeacety la se [Mycena belliae]
MFQSINPLYPVLLSLLIAYLRNPIYSENRITNQVDPVASTQTAGNILLLTAHPDDECMFFAPTVLALAVLQSPTVSGARDPRSALYSLCLSVGNADGLGPIRKYELESSLDILGVASDKRMVLDHPDLQDNSTAYWDSDIIANVLKPYILENRITTILTFDEDGISGHPNHRSLPAGVKQLMSTLKEVQLFTLITTPLPTKYGGIIAPVLAKFDLYASALLHLLETQLTRVLLKFDVSISPSSQEEPRPETMPVFVSGLKEYWAAVQAMRAHPSQLVWFRWLYILFSRYMWVNEWNEVRVA